MLDRRTGIRRVYAAFLCVCLVLFMSFSVSGRSVGTTWEKQITELFTTSALLESSVTDLMAAMDSGRITSVQLVQMYLDRIEAYDDSLGLNAYITVNPDVLSEAAAADEARASGAGGRLLGIPVVIKDNIDVKGLPTTNGLSSNLSKKASEDAWIVSRLREEGAVIMGKSNLSQESASGQTTRSSAGGTTHNAYDTSRTPAGSSGGSAVAVACNFAAFGIGTDTASSIRRPASFAGLYGLRPSYGLVSREGTVIVNDAYDTPGILTKTAEDAALVLDIIAGTDPGDSVTASADSMIPEDGYLSWTLQGRSFEGLRIGYLANSFGYYYESSTGERLRRPTELSSRIKGMVDRALAVFTDNGAELVDISGYMSEEYINRVRDGGVAFFRRAIDDILEDLEIDAVVYVSQTDVPEIETTASWRSDNQSYYINVFSPIVGLPEIMLPMGLSETDPSNGINNGLALGLSMFAQYGRDADLLAIAAEYERLSDTRTLPVTVPALPDNALAELAARAKDRAEGIIGTFSLSEGSLGGVSSALEALKASSMDVTEDTSKVSVAQYRELLYRLCLELDSVEIVTGSVPVRSVETLRFFVQRYRRAISVSSVSVLLFSFAMLLTKGGKKQRRTYLEIPQISSGVSANDSALQRFRSAITAVREQRKLLRDARKNGISAEELARRAGGFTRSASAPAAGPMEGAGFQGLSSRISGSVSNGRKKRPLITENRLTLKERFAQWLSKRKEAREAAGRAAAERRALREAEQLRRKELQKASRLASNELAARQKAAREAARIEKKAQQESRKRAAAEKAADRRSVKDAARIEARAEKARENEKKKASREKAAALRSEANLARRQANAQKRKDTVAVVKAFFVAFIANVKSSFASWSEQRRTARETAQEQHRIDAAAEALQRKQKRETAVREAAAREEERRQAELRKEEEKAQRRSEKEALKEAQRNARELEKAQEQERKIIAQKERAYAAQQKKKEKAEKRAAFAASIAAFFNGIGDMLALRNAEWVARREQKEIAKAAKQQLKVAARLRKKQENDDRKLAARAARMELSAEKRRLKEEREIEQTAAVEFRKLQRKKKRELFFSSIRDYFRSAEEARRQRREDRRIHRAEQLFIRNAEIRDKKRQIEELKAERARIAEETLLREAAQKEKKAQAETAKREAEAAYRAMIDDRISQQIEYLEKQSEQRRQADLERKRLKEERLQEKAAQKKALEDRRKEEKLRLEQEKEAMRQARKNAEEERRAKEEKIREEKRAEAAKRNFEKNKDKIISAQRREVKRLNRQEKRRIAREEAATARLERRLIRRKKFTLFLQDIPAVIRGIPIRIRNYVKAADEARTARVEAARLQKAQESEKRRQAKAEIALKRSNERAEAERIKQEQRAAAQLVKHDKAEAKAVSRRLKKQEIAERKAKAEKERTRIREERSAKRNAAALARAEKRKAVSLAFSKAVSSVSSWIKSIFSTTENWLKRIGMIIAGILTFIFMIPKRVFGAFLMIPKVISSARQKSAQKRALRAEQRVFRKEQRRIAGEKQKAVGVMKEGTAATTAGPAETVIVNMEKEAPFWFTQKTLRDFVKPYRLSAAVTVLTCIYQAFCFAASLVLISDGLSIVKNYQFDRDSLALLLKAAFVIVTGLIANFINRGLTASMQKGIAREMRRVEFSLRKDADRAITISEEIVRVQELIGDKCRLVYDVCLVIASVTAMCISSPFNAVVLVVCVLIGISIRKAESRKLGECKSVEEAESLREAVAADWARKLRVNKLLGRGNDSYDNVRNATLDVNIRKLAVRDVTTDAKISKRTVQYAVLVAVCAVTYLLPFAKISDLFQWLYPAVQIYVIVPGMINGISGLTEKVKARKELSKAVAEKLEMKNRIGGEADGT